MPLNTVRIRRRARRMALWNGVLWAIGNGLAGSTLVIYLTRELHAERLGLYVSLILAAPQVAGLLQLAAPAMIGRLADRRRFCLGAFSTSALALLAWPCVCSPDWLLSPGGALAALIVLWCMHHVAHSLGMVALWSWLADMAPTRIRGRFLGWRQRWTVGGGAVAAVAAGLFVWRLPKTFSALPSWMPYGILTAVGAAFMLAALWPLARMPALARRSPAPPRRAVRLLLKPLTDTRFLRLLLYGCWFSFWNGITNSAQRVFTVAVLELDLLTSLTLETGTRLGQWAISPRVGRLADRLGNRPVMIASQLLVAAGLLCYAVATPAGWLWAAVAAALWVAYAGLNVCLPSLTLRLSPRELNTTYVATFDGVRGLFYAASTVLGGLLVDSGHRWFGCDRLAMLPILFVFGWAVRSLGAVLLLLIIEPPATERRSDERPPGR